MHSFLYHLNNKRSLIKTGTLVLFFTFFHADSFAQWYEAKGTAVIINNDIKTAKNKAVQNALKKALLVAGASVSSVQQVVNGLLTQDEINIRASGNVSSLELINENYTDSLVTVQIRADIFPQEKKCLSSNFKKSIVLTRSHITHREQANLGNLYPIEKELMIHLAKKLKQQNLNFNPVIATETKSSFYRLNQTLQRSQIKEIVKSIANQTASQYVVFSEINNLSVINSKKSMWGFWQGENRERHFNHIFYLYDGITGEEVFSKQYHSSAPWLFKKRDKIDVASQYFWRSTYGEKISQNLDLFISEIAEQMMCEPSQGKIVHVKGNQIIFNLGKRHGVKVNDEFSLLHVEHVLGKENKILQNFNISEQQVIVQQVTFDTATAITTDNKILSNIQINDLVTR